MEKHGTALNSWFKNTTAFGVDAGVLIFTKNLQIMNEVPKPISVLKKKLMEEGKTHASLVFKNEECIAWCQFGSPEEPPGIYHKKEVEAKFAIPDWRITCFFTDKDHRKKGLSAVALKGALELIKNLGGGIAESYPQDTPGKNISSSFLYNGTKQIFEQAGFNYEGKKGKNHCVMRTLV
jgi:hypothetical protein